uniref:Lon N-terminal domain-containing protein n=1 Tax=Aureoumbra lagunensis TaxID=44058 RepID=A0A6S8D796_9STRA
MLFILSLFITFAIMAKAFQLAHSPRRRIKFLKVKFPLVEEERIIPKELPVFDPLDDELMFPIPFDAQGTSYRFSRAMHIRLIKAALELPIPAFFHAVSGAKEGGRGCVCLISLAQEEEENQEDVTPYLVQVVCAGRGEIKEIIQTFPFARAKIVEIQDTNEEESNDDSLQRETFEALRQVAALSTRIENRGPFAQAATARLEALEASLVRLQEEELEILANGGLRASLTRRRERAGFFLLTHLTPSFHVACQALCTTNGNERLKLFRDFLTNLRADLAARAALDSLQPQSSQDDSSITLNPNQFLEYWWSPSDGWWEARISAVIPNEPGFYDVDFLDGERPIRLQLDSTTRARWRLLQPPGERQNNKRKSRGGADLLFGDDISSTSNTIDDDDDDLNSINNVDNNV